MSVRSTNVYEERALGVYHHPDQDWETETPEPEIKDFHKGHRREVFSKYLAWHMRRQLAFDIWPLALAIWAICCFERGKILDPETSSWFSVFRIIFECTSAYSTIGLSMGTPNNNYSFSGEFGTASKIVVSVSSRGGWIWRWWRGGRREAGSGKRETEGRRRGNGRRARGTRA
jgi:Trk-type K+ transport system membrane component